MQDRRIHVAIIFSHIGPYHVARLRAAQGVCQEKGWQFTAIQSIGKTEEHPWGDDAQVEDLPIRTLLKPSSTSNPSELHPDSAMAATAVEFCLEELEPDVLVIPGWGFKLSRAALRWCRRRNVLAILMSESKQDDELRIWWKERLKSWLYVRKYAAAIVGGTAHKHYLVALGMKGDRIFYGYDTIDNKYFIQQSEAVRQDPSLARQQHEVLERPYFLSVTRLIPRKNVVRLVEAFSNYRDAVGTDEAWNLAICGSGTDRQAIEQLILDKNLNDLVHLPGFLTYQQIAQWYGLANAFVHPALVEQWGLVVNEACASGLPVLCSRTVGACSTLVQQAVNGFTFDPNSTAGITDALLKMHRTSQEDRVAMGKSSQRIVAQYGPEQFGLGLYNAIASALSTHPNSTNQSKTV